MSKTIDEKVVSMQFDNRNFEKNVNTTLSTLDKLKQKLKFDGATKGLENISTVAKQVDLSNISNSAETLKLKFSALDVVAVTALTRITNTMMNFASKTLSFLTSGIVQGGISRAMNIENARFQLQGLLQDESAVAAVMQNVKDSVDGTAYSLDAAATVASQLAASGMKAGDKMYKTLLGVAGVAAMTNSEYSEIGRIYTQVAGQGRLMGDQLLQLSGRGMNAAATLGKALNKSEAEIRDMVSKGKIDFDTFSTAMYDAFGTQAKKANETFTGSLANIKSALARIGESFVSPLIVSGGPLVQLFNAIRVKVNEFKDMVVPVAEKVSEKLGSIITLTAKAIKGENADIGGSTGWDNLAKKITEAGIPLEKFQNEFSKVAKKYNIDMDSLIKKSGSFGSALTKMKNPGKIAIETLQNISKEYKKTGATQEDLQKKLQKFQEVVDKVWNGDYKNQPFRADLLKKAGYDYAEVQTLVNKTVDKHRLTLEDLSEAQLKSIGYTDEEVKSIKELAKQAKESGTPINELINNMGKLSKGQLVFQTLSNVIQPITTIVKSFASALNGAFTLSNGNNLYGILDSLHSMSESFVMTEETADKLTRTFKGLFAAIDLITNIAGGGFRFAFQIIAKILEETFKALGFVNVNLLSVTAAIGDAVVKFRDWYKEHNLINKIIEATVPLLIKVLGVFSTLIDKLLEIPQVQDAIKTVTNAVDDFCTGISNWFDKATKGIDEFTKSISSLDLSKLSLDGLTKVFDNGLLGRIASLFDKIPKFSIEGLKNGFTNGAQEVITAVVALASDLVSAFCERLGIHSPSTVFIDIAKYCIKGLTVGFGSGLSPIITLINKIIDVITSPFNSIDFDAMSKRLDELGGLFVKAAKGVGAFFGNIDVGKIAALGMSAGLLWILKQLVDVLDSIVSPLEGVTNVLNSFSKVLSGLSSIEGAYAKNLKAKAFKELAEALGILAIAIIGLSAIDTGKLFITIGAISLLATVLGTLAFAMSKMELGEMDFAKFSLFMLSMSASILLISKAITSMGKLNPEQAIQGFGGLIVIFGLLSILMTGYGQFVKGAAAANIDKAGEMILKISASLILLTVALKLMGKLSVNDIQNGIMVIGSFIGAIALLGLINKKYGSDFNNLGTTILKLSASLILLTVAIKLIGTLSKRDISNGVSALTAFVVFVGSLVAVTKIGSEEQIAKVGGLVLAISVSMILLAATAKILGGMDNEALLKGVSGVVIFGLLIEALIASMKSLTVDSGRIALTMLAMSVSVGILAGISVLLSLVDLKGLAKGVTAVGFLGLIVAGMVYCAKGVGDCKGTIMMLSVAIATLAISVAALSFIDTKKLASATTALITLMLSLSVMMKAAGKMDSGLAKPLVVMALIVGTLGVILYGLTELPIDKAVPIADAMSRLILSLSAACAILTGVGQFSSAAFTGIAALSALILAVGTIMTTVGWFANKYGGLEKSIKKGIEILNLIGHGLGEFFGNIVSGFASGVLNVLPDIGSKLTEFWDNSEGFFEGIKSVGSDTITSVKNLAKALMLLTAADLLDRLTSWLVGAPDFKNFSNSLEELGNGLSKFSDSVKGVNSEVTKNASEALVNLANASKSMPKEGGWLQKLTGNINIEDFGNKLIPLGAGLKSFSDSVGNVNADAVKNASEALVNLANASKSMPKEGGWLQKILGDTSIENFGNSLDGLGKGLNDFANNTKDIKEDSINSAVKALKTLVAIKIPKEGGLWEKITGKASLGNLGNNLTSLGEGLNNFHTKLANIDIDVINTAIKAIKSVVGIAKSLSEITFNADNFGRMCAGIGEGLKKVSDATKGVTSKKFNSLKTSVTNMRGIIESLVGIDTSGVDAYAKAVKALGKASSVSIKESMNSAAKSAKSSATKVFTTMVSTAHANRSSVSKAFSSTANAGATAIKSKQPTYKSAGTALVRGLSNGIKSGQSSAKNAASSVASHASTGIKGYYNSFYDSGKSLGDGFISGIASKTKAAAKQAASMGKAAADALHSALKINSPSKVTRKDGGSFGEGFVLGIKDTITTVKTMAGTMASNAVDGMRNTLDMVKGIALGDISIDPTITPSMDLANIKAGFNQMNSMFGRTRSLALASSINVQSQAQSLRDVVDNAVNSAIGKITETNQNEAEQGNITIEVPVNLDGREVARATAPYTKKEIDKLQKRNDRKRGIL